MLRNAMIVLAVLLSWRSVYAEAPAAASAPHVILETSLGNIEVKFFPEVAPKGCENFLTHVKDGYYDNTKFHRIVRGFVIQGGDPTNLGNGGKSIWGDPFDVEASPDLLYDRPGLLAYANRGPKTNESQFFITVAAAHHLDRKYTIFGEVVAGMDVVEKINRVPLIPPDRPVEPPPMLLRAYVKPEATPINGAPPVE